MLLPLFHFGNERRGGILGWKKKNLHDEHTGETITRTACKDRLLLINTARRWCRDVYLQTVMRFFRSTQTLRADAFFDVRPIAIAVCIQPDSIQRRPRGLFGIRAQARTSPSAGPESYKHRPSSAGSHGCCYSRCWKRRRTGSKRLEPSYTYLSVHIPVKTFKIKPSSRFHHRFMNYTGISSLPVSGKKSDCWCFYVFVCVISCLTLADRLGSTEFSKG